MYVIYACMHVCMHACVYSILFNLVVASLPELVNQFRSTPLVFADDKTLFSSTSSACRAVCNLSKALSVISSTLSDSGLTVNVEKTRLMLVTPSASSEAVCSPPVLLNGSEINVTNSMRCLGVLISKNFSWRRHVDVIAAKVSRKLGVLRHMSRFMPADVRCTLFFSVIQPDLEYAIVAFVTSMSAADRNRLLALHRKGVRIVGGAHPQADTEELYVRLNIVPLDVRWVLKLGTFVFSCHQTNSPLCLSSLFTPLSSHYPTHASTNGKCLVPRSGTMFGTNAISKRLSLLWNSLPSDITPLPSRKLFKGALLNHLTVTSNLSQCLHLLFDRLAMIWVAAILCLFSIFLFLFPSFLFLFDPLFHCSSELLRLRIQINLLLLLLKREDQQCSVDRPPA